MSVSLSFMFLFYKFHSAHYRVYLLTLWQELYILSVHGAKDKEHCKVHNAGRKDSCDNGYL